MSERTFPWRTLLFVSVALNLLVAGVGIGAYGAGIRLERESEGGHFPAPRALMAALPPESRVKVRGELARTWAQTRTLRQQAAQARRDAFDAADVEPFDQDRVRAAFAHVRASDDAALAAFHDNVIAALARMSPEERRRALIALRNAPPMRRQAMMTPGAIEEAAPSPEDAEPPLYGGPRQRLRAAIRERRREERGVAP